MPPPPPPPQDGASAPQKPPEKPASVDVVECPNCGAELKYDAGVQGFEWLKQIGWQAPDDAARALRDRHVNLAQFAQLAYGARKASLSVP